MDIGEVSKTCGLPASTLRFYEEKGLIESVGRNGLRRSYSSTIVERVALISLARSAGFSLDEIGEMFTANHREINRELLLEKADQIDKQIKALKSMSDGLRHAAACKASNHFECPTFLRLLRLAGKNRTRMPNKLTGEKKTRKF